VETDQSLIAGRTVEPRHARTSRDRWWFAGALLLALTPVLAVLAVRVGHHVTLLGDEASIDLRVRDVFTAQTPLVGTYSRGFNHPGPLLFWLLAPLSVLSGGAPWATVVGGAVLQGVAIAASGWIAFRRGGLVLGLGVLFALGCAYSSFLLGSQFLEAWNPYIAFPFFMLYLLQVWSAAIGVRWQVLGAAVVGTLLVQLHIGYVPVVAVTAVWAAAVLVHDRRRREATSDQDRPTWRCVLGVTGAAMALLWVVPLVEQATRAPGNLTAIWRHFRDVGGTVGIARAAGVYAAELHVLPPWLGGSDALGFLTGILQPVSAWWLLVGVALLAVGLVAARRSGRRDDRRMLELAAITAVTAIVAIARIDVVLADFLVYWRVVSAVFLVLAAVWAVASWIGIDRRATARTVLAVLLTVGIAGMFLTRVRDDVWRDRDHVNPIEQSAERLFAAARRSAPHDQRVLVRGLGTTTDGVAQGLIDDLDRHGVDVRVDRDAAFQYGRGRTATPADVGKVWYVSPNGSTLGLLDEYPDARLVASVTPLPPAREAELRALQASVRAQLAAIGRTDVDLDSPFLGTAGQEVRGIDPGEVDRLGALNRRVADTGRCRCVVIEFPADGAPELPSSVGF
jgi:hypothetical protein